MNDREAPSGGPIDRGDRANELYDTRFFELLERERALQIMDEAWDRFESRAREEGDAALHRVEVLRLRSQENMSPREICKVLGGNPAQVSRDHAEAREEFTATLRVVVGVHTGCVGKDLDEAIRQVITNLGRRE